MPYLPMLRYYANPRDTAILHLGIRIQAFSYGIGDGFLFQFLKKLYLFLLLCHIPIYLRGFTFQITHNLLLLSKRGRGMKDLLSNG